MKNFIFSKNTLNIVARQIKVIALKNTREFDSEYGFVFAFALLLVFVLVLFGFLLFYYIQIRHKFVSEFLLVSLFVLALLWNISLEIILIVVSKFPLLIVLLSVSILSWISILVSLQV